MCGAVRETHVFARVCFGSKSIGTSSDRTIEMSGGRREVMRAANSAAGNTLSAEG
jgi:hypothetical protein